MHEVDLTYQEIATALAVQSIGGALGPVVGGACAARTPRHEYVPVIVAVLMTSGATLAVPWCSTMQQLAVTLFLQGFGGAHISAGERASEDDGVDNDCCYCCCFVVATK